jgi:hypothetical protein
MTPEQHAKAAEEILASLRDPRIPEGSDQEVTWALMEAQVHATLALRTLPAAPEFTPTHDTIDGRDL